MTKTVVRIIKIDERCKEQGEVLAQYGHGGKDIDIDGHPNIFETRDVYRDSSSCYIVMDHHKQLDGSTAEDWTIERLGEVTADMVLALEHIHGLEIAHRDIKLGNFLMADDGRVVLTDFGLARKTQQPKYEGHGVAKCQPPEVWKGSYGRKADMWSLGVVLFELVCRFPPFYGNSGIDDLSLYQIIDGNLWTDFGFEELPQGFQDLMKGLLEPEPRRRLSAERALQNPFIQAALSQRAQGRSQPWTPSFRGV
ncbi:unnamed protein product [Vitrella brassicaformis CCMP3155]|uniref:Protein kinase domain-containing protein n=1 Tax=Vitrella brassicaformis (strain CCMP3155) TaxID=1169540 RepID=A0A0G4FXH8_VITBC|nr:unnamed protein product [Vitrella brassicaformis CCMP3155]|eukprot:CEM20114.1 unnamed protein product [Vitrella brassicaformis CCMP3155]